MASSNSPERRQGLLFRYLEIFWLPVGCEEGQPGFLLGVRGGSAWLPAGCEMGQPGYLLGVRWVSLGTCWVWDGSAWVRTGDLPVFYHPPSPPPWTRTPSAVRHRSARQNYKFFWVISAIKSVKRIHKLFYLGPMLFPVGVPHFEIFRKLFVLPCFVDLQWGTRAFKNRCWVNVISTSVCFLP